MTDTPSSPEPKQPAGAQDKKGSTGKAAGAKGQSSDSSWLGGQRENIQTIVVAVFLALFIRQFVAEARYIPSGSMKPTLQIDDRLVVEKISYECSSGYFNWQALSSFDWSNAWRCTGHLSDPARHQIVVFTPPTKVVRQLGTDQAFIKRVIGVPGDTVAVSGGRVFVNGVPQTETYIAEKPNYEMSQRTVPPGHYFVMGDNRNDSYDSHWWGFLPRENVIGRACFRFWPLNRVGPVD